MTWKQFAKKVSSLLKSKEPLDLLNFKYKGVEYRIISQWGSGKDRELVNLWAKKCDEESDRIYSFSSEQVDRLVFFRLEKE